MPLSIEPLDPMASAMGKPDSQPHSVEPSEADIDRLEKVVWDADVEHVLIWYREQIQQLRECVRMTERAWKLDVDRRTLLAELVATVRGECPSLLDEDSGGNARLSLAIDAALSPPSTAPKGGQ